MPFYKRHSFASLLLAGVFVFAGCTDEGLLSPSGESATASKYDPNLRNSPVSFTATLYTDLVSLGPDAGRCGAPPWLLNVQHGEGWAQAFGKFTVDISFCVDATAILNDGVVTEGESLPYNSGEGTLTFRNGDELYMTIAGVVELSDNPDYDFEFNDPFEFDGGTGRFKGATGDGATASLVDFQSVPSRTYHHFTASLTLPRQNQ